ncbi:MAG: hydrolase [Pseudomonadota bacterium]
MSNFSFKPAWWLPGGHLQTLWPNLRKRKIFLNTVRERLILPDNDFVDLDWVQGINSGPIVILMHGLEGSIKSSYVRGILCALKKNGFRAVLMNFRGCSGEHNHTSKAYHAGETSDFDFVVKTLHKRYPLEKIAAIGFSLGGNVLLKYLGETQDNNLLSCAVAVSVPFLLNRSADRMQTGFSIVYQKKLLALLRKKIVDKNKLLSLPIDIDTIQNIKNFWQFDTEVTAKLYGFKNAEEYYQRSSSAYYLSSIKIPTLIIHASNDPFLYADAIPPRTALPSCVQFVLSKSGGHVGFVSGAIPGRARYWLEEKIPDAIKDMICIKK